jgi:hypothetical protein
MSNSADLQSIAAAVTPAVMVSACGLLALGLDNQAARMTTRLRDLAKEFRTLAPGVARRVAIRGEVVVLKERHRFYTRALLSNYAALLAFVLTSTTSLLQSLLGFTAMAPLGLFGVGVGLLATMAIYTLSAVRLSRRAIELEERDVLADE